MKVGVVIPFYQREKGILTRALDSVRNQDLDENIRLEVIVVDDQSPVSAASEMAAFADTGQISWHSVSQPNGGPGAARNTGIDWLQARGASYIAFLDSDDEWRADHLAYAISALEAGGDFYFSDHARLGHFESFFYSDPFVAPAIDRLRRTGGDFQPGETWNFAAGALTAEVATSYLAQTSTVVVRATTLGDIRFDPELRYSGEDHMMWVRLAAAGARICVGDRIEVTCGSGINMYYGSFDWDSDGALRRIASQIIFLHQVVRMPIADALPEMVARLREQKRLYAFLLARQLVKRGRPVRSGLAQVLRHDPLIGVQGPFLAASYVLGRSRARGGASRTD